MTTDPQPRVGTFRREPQSPGRAISACVLRSASGGQHGLDLTVTQAKALSLALSRAILEYESIALDCDRAVDRDDSAASFATLGCAG